MLSTQLKTYTSSFINKVLNREGGGFAKRIRHRNSEFWGTPEGKTIKAIPMDAQDPLTKWQDIKYWQRKLSNKHNSIEFAKKYGCLVPEIYWQGSDVSTIYTQNLPDKFFIKPTIGAGSKLVFLMDGTFNLMDQQHYTLDAIVAKLGEAVRNDSRLEFIVQEFLRTEEGNYKIPDDYKIYLFNGEIACIQLINRLSPHKGFTTCYDENWKQIKEINTYYAKGAYQPPPACLPEMLEQAKRLSKVYEIFVRIDFYATDKGAVFGEFTPTPFMGKSFTPAGEQMLLAYWDKYCPGMI
ncbi:ATP-grasp fold amidoligase family protein [Pontibacter fetidus]|uniref:Teichuronopeptide biosynthesis TupA-like protein n=1 Tax=Pontibacter fetidus TaxID=2700082 RepID=A0A6B2H609_9BACT|nr:ATP-grasp fold amidoligase family protein [Pontibacter fetidus]NDK54592.1 hypothetical protein [Pontibacter fetidus]